MKTPHIVDVGSGAGIPGLPLKIVYPHWVLALVESIGKKARFLEQAIAEVGLDGVTVTAQRAEELGRDRAWRDVADLCLARAVAPLPTLLELCAPLVRPGGILAFPKSGNVEVEVDEAAAAAGALHARLRNITAVDPELGLGEGRVVVLYDRVGTTPGGYPRRIGMARSRPIGASPPVRGAKRGKLESRRISPNSP